MRILERLRMLVLVSIGLMLGVGFGQSVHAAIIINEVLADPPSVGGDANGDGNVSSSQDEFVELLNTSNSAESLVGWTLEDAVSVRHVFAATAVVPPGQFLVVFGGGTPQGFLQAVTASSGALGLNNSGDTVTLRDTTGALIDVLSYGSEGGRDVSLTRFPDATGVFVSHTTAATQRFSPGQTVDGLTQWFDPSAAPPLGPPAGPSLGPAASSTMIPEPGSLALLGLGLFGGLIKMRSRRE